MDKKYRVSKLFTELGFIRELIGTSIEETTEESVR